MGMFSRHDKARALQDAQRIASGRGLTGRLATAFMGKDAMRQVGASVQAAQDVETARAAMSAGVATIPATVLAVHDTGKMVNHDPVVVLTVTLSTGEQFPMETLVSKLQIPRVGDRVGLARHPQVPGQYLYCGPFTG